MLLAISDWWNNIQRWDCGCVVEWDNFWKRLNKYVLECRWCKDVRRERESLAAHRKRVDNSTWGKQVYYPNENFAEVQ